jgi:ribonuclease G
MEAFGVEQEIKSTLNRRVDLPSGGYLIFDYAEAFTVIDVNTGRFVGSRSKKSAGRLEDTITKNNLEAVKEVVRQLRLRDVGGIIVIDFIDMANPKNRAAVEEALRQELERDRTKTYVVEISPLGLVEMTRQNVTDGPREVMTRKCPTCGGDGIIVSESTTALEIERKLRALVAPGSRTKAFKVEVNAKVAALIAGPAAVRLRELEETTKRRFFLVGKNDIHLDHFRVLEQGTVEALGPDAPVSAGQELELKLGEVGLHDSHAGVGKVDGLDVSVAEAARLVGKKVRVRVTAVLEGIAYAERPVKKAATEDDDGAEDEQEAEAEEEEEEEDVAAEVGEDGEPAVAAKKRTRRGTRGGRNRRKKPVGAETGEPVDGEPAPEPVAEAEAEAHAEAEEGPAAEPEPQIDEPSAGPVIHVPGPEIGRDGDEASQNGEQAAAAAARKRTRRGSRGGRNRRKKPATVAAGAALDAESEEGAEAVVEPEREPELQSDNGAEASPEPEPEAQSDEWEYTPMSQWDGLSDSERDQ